MTELERAVRWLIGRQVPQGDNRCQTCDHAPSHHSGAQGGCVWPHPVVPAVLCDCDRFKPAGDTPPRGTATATAVPADPTLQPPPEPPPPPNRADPRLIGYIERGQKPVESRPQLVAPVPPFDPDPEIVADLEGNRWATRAFRKHAQKAHDEAERQRGEAERQRGERR